MREYQPTTVKQQVDELLDNTARVQCAQLGYVPKETVTGSDSMWSELPFFAFVLAVLFIGTIAAEAARLLVIRRARRRFLQRMRFRRMLRWAAAEQEEEAQ